MNTETATRVAPNSLPPLSEVAAELVATLSRDTTHGADLARLVARDPVLAGATLKLANSSFFGLAGRVSSMHDAVTLIGFSAVRNMLLIMSMRGALRPPPDVMDSQAMWLHALETAAAARALARANGLSGDEAFLAGLLHDLGKLVLACTSPDAARSVARHAQDNRCSYGEAESALGVTSHESAGVALAVAWRLPSVLALAMSHHHAPMPDDPLLVHVVHLANVIAHVARCDDAKPEPAPPIRMLSWQRLVPSESDLERAVTAARRMRQGAGEWRALLDET